MVLYATILPSASRPGAARPIEAAGIDPRQHPILAEHYGTEPLRPIGKIAAEVVADIRLRRRVEQPHERRTA